MCKERRATFQKTAMEDDGTIHPSFSINLTKIQAVAAIFVAIFTLFGSVGSAVLWTRNSIVETVDDAWGVRLLQFHEIAKPAIRTMVREEVQHHERRPAHGDVVSRLIDLETANAAEGARLEAIEKWLERIDRNIGVLVRNGEGR